MSHQVRSKLEQLKEWWEAGLLTEPEYQSQKATVVAAAMGIPPAMAPNQLSGGTTASTRASLYESSSGMLAGSTTVEPAPVIPRTIASYRIGEILGSGGMGTVVRARHREEGWARRQGGDVALKLIHPHIAKEADFRERFLNEAELGQRTHHPSLATVYDVVVEGPWLGMVMALVKGSTLADLVKPHGLPLDRVLSLLAPLAEALDHLHGQGIVHRDLKPANIKVCPDGTPMILDLGIAKDLGSGKERTKTRSALGTTAWMAPEQLDSKRVGPPADRYSLGLITYTLLAGRLPWSQGDSEVRIGMAKLSGQLPPLHSVRPDLPFSSCEAVMTMLAPRPADRPQQAADFIALLASGCTARRMRGDTAATANPEQRHVADPKRIRRFLFDLGILQSRPVFDGMKAKSVQQLWDRRERHNEGGMEVSLLYDTISNEVKSFQEQREVMWAEQTTRSVGESLVRQLSSALEASTPPSHQPEWRMRFEEDVADIVRHLEQRVPSHIEHLQSSRDQEAPDLPSLLRGAKAELAQPSTRARYRDWLEEHEVLQHQESTEMKDEWERHLDAAHLASKSPHRSYPNYLDALETAAVFLRGHLVALADVLVCKRAAFVLACAEGILEQEANRIDDHQHTGER